MDAPAEVPFLRISASGRERELVAQAIAGGQLAGPGAFAARCEALLEATLGAPRVILVSSCTHALEMAALLLDLRDGDEVILPAFTFVATANAFALRGARLVFADICADTLNLDPAAVEVRLTPRTRAIVPVHYGGAPCDLAALESLAARSGALIVEDNAHGLFGRYGSRSLGAVGSLGAHSFHGTKTFTCGEGGALAINDARLIGRAEQIRCHGTDRARFMRGEVARYTWQELGSSYLPSELQAAFLLGQLEQREWMMARRRALWTRYHEALHPWAASHGVGAPPVVEGSAHHLFHLVMPSAAQREALAKHLAARRIGSATHYTPLHLSAMGRRLGHREGELPVTETVSERLLRLPLYNDLTDEEQTRVIEAVLGFD